MPCEIYPYVLFCATQKYLVTFVLLEHAGFLKTLFSTSFLVTQPLLATMIFIVRGFIPVGNALGYLPTGPAEWDENTYYKVLTLDTQI